MKEILKELFGRLLMVGFTILIWETNWILTIITPPIIFFIFNTLFCRRDRIFNEKAKAILDLLTWLSYLAYLLFTIILSNQNIERWYSWLIGVLIWIVFSLILGFLAPKRWHYEKIENRL